MEKNSTALEALAAFRKRAASAAPSSSSGTSTSSSTSSMSVEGPSTKSMSYNTPSTGHIGLFKATGFANTGRIKTSEEERRSPLMPLSALGGGALGAGVGGLLAARGNPRWLYEMLRHGGVENARRLAAPVLIGSGLGGAAGAVGGNYLEDRMAKSGEWIDPDTLTEADITMSPERQRRMQRARYPVLGAAGGAGAGALAALLLGRQRANPLVAAGSGMLLGGLGGIALGHLGNRRDQGIKEGALSKFALGVEQPSMITSAMRSAAGRQGGYTAGNLAKGSGAFKPTRLTSTLSEGKSSAMDKTALKTSFLYR